MIQAVKSFLHGFTLLFHNSHRRNLHYFVLTDYVLFFKAAFMYLELALHSIKNAIKFPVSSAFMQSLEKNSFVYQFSAVLPFLLWFHSSNISQRTKLDFVLQEEYALESNVLTDVHPGCLFLLLGPPALLITESLSSVPSLGVWQYTVIQRACSHLGSQWSVKPPLMMNSHFHLCFFSNFTVGAVISIFLSA